MRFFNVSTFNKLLLIGVLSMGASACSSPEDDAEARGESVEIPTTAQDNLETQTTTHDNMGEAHQEMDRSNDDVAVAGADANSAVAQDDIQDDNAEVVDGTQEEEHVSSY